MNLQRFAEADPTPAPEKEKHKVQVEGTKTPDPKAAETKPKTLTQEEFDSLVQDRVARASKSSQEKLAKELGFASVEELTAAAKAHKEAQEAAKTETQRLQEAKEAAERKAQEEATKATEALTKADKRIIRTEVRSLARELGAVDLDDVEILLEKSGGEIKVDEEGNVTGAKEALEALKTAKPHLFTAEKQTPAPVGGPLNPPKKAPANMLEASDEEFAAELRRLGLRPHSSTKSQNQRKG